MVQHMILHTEVLKIERMKKSPNSAASKRLHETEPQSAAA